MKTIELIDNEYIQSLIDLHFKTLFSGVVQSHTTSDLAEYILIDCIDKKIKLFNFDGTRNISTKLLQQTTVNYDSEFVISATGLSISDDVDSDIATNIALLKQINPKYIIIGRKIFKSMDNVYEEYDWYSNEFPSENLEVYFPSVLDMPKNIVAALRYISSKYSPAINRHISDKLLDDLFNILEKSL